ncbi:MAG: hypothetical protein LBQ09_11025, partial [Acidobacteriaceae bacterium]|nr:hypothetical protein [Acidobacteriaceae bacterium]
MNIVTLDSDALRAFERQARQDYDAFKAKQLNLNLGRGKPSNEQLDLCRGLLDLPGAGDYAAADGTDCRNYGGVGASGLDGIPEMRRLFASLLHTEPNEVSVGGNSSLQLMYECV